VNEQGLIAICAAHIGLGLITTAMKGNDGGSAAAPWSGNFTENYQSLIHWVNNSRRAVF